VCPIKLCYVRNQGIKYRLFPFVTTTSLTKGNIFCLSIHLHLLISYSLTYTEVVTSLTVLTWQCIKLIALTTVCLSYVLLGTDVIFCSLSLHRVYKIVSGSQLGCEVEHCCIYWSQAAVLVDL